MGPFARMYVEPPVVIASSNRNRMSSWSVWYASYVLNTFMKTGRWSFDILQSNTLCCGVHQILEIRQRQNTITWIIFFWAVGYIPPYFNIDCYNLHTLPSKIRLLRLIDISLRLVGKTKTKTPTSSHPRCLLRYTSRFRRTASGDTASRPPLGGRLASGKEVVKAKWSFHISCVRTPTRRT